MRGPAGSSLTYAAAAVWKRPPSKETNSQGMFIVFVAQPRWQLTHLRGRGGLSRPRTIKKTQRAFVFFAARPRGQLITDAAGPGQFEGSHPAKKQPVFFRGLGERLSHSRSRGRWDSAFVFVSSAFADKQSFCCAASRNGSLTHVAGAAAATQQKRNTAGVFCCTIPRNDTPNQKKHMNATCLLGRRGYRTKKHGFPHTYNYT